jgi:hypothetical protein
MHVLLAELESVNLEADLLPLRDIARRRWIEGVGTPADLLAAKAACWEFIDSLGGEGLSSTAGRQARALLCVLEPGGDLEVQSMTADWFDDVLRGSLEDRGDGSDFRPGEV